MSKRLMPTYLVDFLRSGYNGDIPKNFGQRMVSRQAIAFTKKLYDIFVGTGAPVNFGCSMLPEYLVKFLDDLRSTNFIVFKDDNTAFIKDVPDISDISCKINKIGGMSYKSENLIVLNDVAETTSNGITYKFQNGIIYLSGTATSNFALNTNLNMSISGNYVLALFNNTALTAGNVRLYHSNNGGNVIVASAIGLETINNYASFTNTNSGIGLGISIPSGTTISGTLQLKPMLVSGTTAPTEFKQGFTGIRDSAVTSVVSKDSSNNTVDTITIDASIQALEGYGQSNPDDSTEYNYIDLENKKYIEVGYIDNGVWTAKDDEIDISSYIDTNIIDIKENGTLTFTNTYDQAVPSEVDYYIPKEAFSNDN